MSAIAVALLEDDVLLRERILLPELRRYGFAVTGLETAAELQSHLQRTPTDIVVLDVGLPDADGFEVAAEVRRQLPEIGIVMLTGRGGAPDRVRGLSGGADAYLAKPVEIEVLAATLHSLARRMYAIPREPVAPRWRLESDGWCLVTPDGRPISLTRTERRLLQPLVEAAGRVVTREDLVAAMTDNVHDFDPHRIDSTIHRLRRKVTDAGIPALPLVAVHGTGYVFTV